MLFRSNKHIGKVCETTNVPVKTYDLFIKAFSVPRTRNQKIRSEKSSGKPNVIRNLSRIVGFFLKNTNCESVGGGKHAEKKVTACEPESIAYVPFQDKTHLVVHKMGEN